MAVVFYDDNNEVREETDDTAGYEFLGWEVREEETDDTAGYEFLCDDDGYLDEAE